MYSCTTEINQHRFNAFELLYCMFEKLLDIVTFVIFWGERMLFLKFTGQPSDKQIKRAPHIRYWEAR